MDEAAVLRDVIEQGFGAGDLSVADRFAGAVLLAEMLVWWDPRVSELTPDGAESIFQPLELQEVGHSRWERVRDALWATCPPALQLFDQAYILTSGRFGPDNATNTLVGYLYQKAFVDLNMGVASAIAWALFIVIFAVTIIQLIGQRRWVHYE